MVVIFVQCLCYSLYDYTLLRLDNFYCHSNHDTYERVMFNAVVIIKSNEKLQYDATAATVDAAGV